MTDYEKIMRGLEGFSKTWGEKPTGIKWIRFAFGDLLSIYEFDIYGYLLTYRAERLGTIHSL